MAQPAKVAIPEAEVVTGLVLQLRVPLVVPPLPAVYVEMARVTEALLTVFPLASLAVTTGWVVKLAPSPTLPAGWVEKVRAETPPDVMETVLELAEVMLPLVALKE